VDGVAGQNHRRRHELNQHLKEKAPWFSFAERLFRPALAFAA
jgi:hypothetical protein